MAKRHGSRYAQGRRTRDWLKVKTHGRQEFVVAGYTRGTGQPRGDVRLARPGRQRGRRAPLRRQRRHGVRRRARSRACSRLLRPLERPESPFRGAAEDAARPARRRHLGRAAPRGRGRVQRVDARRARAPALLQGPPRGQGAVRGAARAAAGGRRPRAAGASFRSRTSTSSSGRTRGSPRATCSSTTAPSRRCSSRICAAGRSRCAATRTAAFGKAFFQKDAPSHMPDWIRTFATEVTTRSKERAKRTVEFPVVDDELALLWMVNMGCIDMNPWYSRVDKPDRPDFVLFDLDPTPEVPYAQTVEVALIAEGPARRARPRVVPEDLGRQGLPRARSARPPLDLRGHPRVRRARRRRDRARLPEARDDRVVEGEAPRRADRREPERDGEDDRVGLLGAAASRRARLDAACVGGGRAPTSIRRRSRWAPCSTGWSGTATSSRAC